MSDVEFEPYDDGNLKRIGTGNEDDMRKHEQRPFNQNKFKSRNYTILIILVVVITAVFSFFYYQRTALYPKQTKTELLEIRNALYLYKESFGVYPTQLTELTKSRPLRETWLTDAWGNPYQYEVDESLQSFSIKSAGYDGRFGSDDDIKSKN